MMFSNGGLSFRLQSHRWKVIWTLFAPMWLAILLNKLGPGNMLKWITFIDETLGAEFQNCLFDLTNSLRTLYELWDLTTTYFWRSWPDEIMWFDFLSKLFSHRAHEYPFFIESWVWESMRIPWSFLCVFGCSSCLFRFLSLYLGVREPASYWRSDDRRLIAIHVAHLDLSIIPYDWFLKFLKLLWYRLPACGRS